MAATGLEPTGTADSVAVRFVSWLGETRQPWLVVLDDLPETVDLTGLWPDGPAGRLLITSPRPAPAVGRPGTRVIPVGFFSTREALNGLSERLSANPVQRQGAIDLVETLGCEPLALGQASAVVASSNLTCRDYRDLFLQRRDEIWTRRRRDPVGGHGDLDPRAWSGRNRCCRARRSGSCSSSWPCSMVTAFPAAVFGAQALIAYLGGAATPFSAAADPRQVWDVLLALERAGLIVINRDVTPPTVLMSSALQEAIKLAAPAEVQEPAARAAASALLEVWPADEPSPWAAASLRANAASLQDSALDALWADGCHPLLLRVGRSLDEARLAGPAVEFWQDLAARCDAKLTPGHPDALAVADHLAAAYLAAGSAEEAVQWYQRVLADRTRELTPGHPAIVAARVSLARALIMAGEPADAVTVMLRAVGEYEQSRGDGHPETLSARDELATAYQAAGDYAAAGRLLARSLADRERLQGPRDPLTMATRERLAAACLAEGKVKDAISQYKRVLSDREKVLGRGSSGYDRDRREPVRRVSGGRADAGRDAVRRAMLRGFGARPRSRPRGHAGPPGEPGPPVLRRGAGRRRGGAAPRYRGALRAGPAVWAPADADRPSEPGEHGRGLSRRPPRCLPDWAISASWRHLSESAVTISQVAICASRALNQAFRCPRRPACRQQDRRPR